MTTINDVAEEAGVSAATVSRVLSNKPHVRDELRERVLQAIERLDYRPNMAARRLRSQTSNVIGLVMADIQNPFFTEIARAVQDMAYEHQFGLFLCNTDEDPEKEQEYIDLLESESVAGVIIAPTQATAREFDELDLSYPVAVIDRAVQVDDRANVDIILLDNVEAMCRLVTHLVERGHQRIGGLFGSNSVTGDQRLAGYEKALRDSGMEIRPELIRRVAPRLITARQATGELLEGDHPPDAIVTTNSLLTAGAMEAVNNSGLSVPDDIALAGFDDAIWTTLVKPQITVIKQPTYEMGRLATELLIQRITTPNVPSRKVVLRGTFIPRASTKLAGGPSDS